WPFGAAPIPLAAVPTTRNCPEPATTSEIMRRKNALSSTTRTEGRSKLIDQAPDRTHLDFHIGGVKTHRTPLAPAHRLGDNRNAVGAQRPATRHDSAVAHLDGSGRIEVGEHARPSHQARKETARVGTKRRHLCDECGHSRLREPAWSLTVTAQRGRRKKNVRQPTEPGGRIVEGDAHATAQSEGTQDLVSRGGLDLGNPHHLLASHLNRFPVDAFTGLDQSELV